MFRFLLGVLVGAAAAAAYFARDDLKPSAAGGRVRELAGASHNVIADPELNAGDATPSEAELRG